MHRYFVLGLSLFLVLCQACKPEQPQPASVLHAEREKITTIPEETQSEAPENRDRAIWQKPSLVIDMLGDVSQKVIADLGAGSGYFSFKFAQKAQKVIAIDIDPKAVSYMDSIKHRSPLKDKIETRLAIPSNPNLKPQEVDVIVVINTIAFLPDLPRYLQRLKAALKPGGKIMVIDYKMKKLPINAPPKRDRMYHDAIEDRLLEAGLTLVTSDDTSLDYQYVVVAQK
jgi:SAM-dependent methyltransferase